VENLETFAKRRLRAHKSFSTPLRLAAASKAKRSGIVRVFNAFKALALTAGYLRKINKFALQALFFKGLTL